MKFSEIIKQASDLIRQNGRITYRSLKREFDLDDEGLEDLKDELLFSRPDIYEVDRRGLIWNGYGESPSTLTSTPSQPQSPVSYTPQHLADRILAEQAAMESRGSADGERKTITALFADLKGSTALIEGLDPEDARAIIDPALQLMMDAVHRYDGYVAQALGDGIFALFGAPIAHEDHPQRALYAALHMQEEMRAYADQSRLKGGIPLQMRVGINTGEVVVRSIRKDDLHTDYVPVGHSTNLAARMEQLATPGSIVISEHTRKLTEGYFDLKALGAADIKGVEEPLNVYEVLGAGPLRTRLQVSARRGLTRFVGRHSELNQMQQALDQAKVGHGQIVGVMGEPGLGKSRLFHEFKLTSQTGCFALEAFSVSHGKASPYLPLIELLRTYFQLEPTDDERTRKEKVNGKILTLDRSLEDIVPYLFALLGIEDPQSSLQQMDAQIRRQRTSEALKKLFLRESLNQPLLLIFEDLHWLDTETQGFLDMLSDSVASAQLLLLVNYRPEYRHEWGQKTYYTQLRLSPLGKEEAQELLTFLLGSDASLTPLEALILEKTDGTPFFMEEVVQTLVEEGTLRGERGNYRLETTPTELHISPTVQGVLAARIDRLTADEKELFQQLAVIGRQFPLRLIKQVVTQTEDSLHRVLSSLQAKEFLYEQPAFPEVEYLFKHALTQEVAYGTVLQEQRKALHERTGQGIEILYQETLDDHYSELAHHYRHSDNTEKAVEYLHLAGQQAVQRSANAEAIRHLTTAVELVHTWPDTVQRSQRELVLQTALGVPVMATYGWTASEVEAVYTRARELCQQIGDTLQLFPTLWHLSYLYSMRAEYQTAQELGEQCLSLAQRLDDTALAIEAHYIVGLTLGFRGEFISAREHFEQTLTLYDPHQHAALARTYAEQDAAVFCHIDVGYVLWFLGYPDQAAHELHAATTLAHELRQDFSFGWAMIMAGWVSLLRGEVKAAVEQSQAGLALSTEHGFSSTQAMGLVWHGYALAAGGQTAAGLTQMREGMAVYRATGGRTGWSVWLAQLASVHEKSKQKEAGLQAVTEALDFVTETGERWSEAELYRLKGELTLQKSKVESHSSQVEEEVEACFHKAIEIAQKQEAKSWELRAATSLARLWQSQDKTTEAHDLLAPVYDWFTEGFDTADLKGAKALLDALA